MYVEKCCVIVTNRELTSDFAEGRHGNANAALYLLCKNFVSLSSNIVAGA